ncbi:transposase [Rhodococcus sp. (in: high G+C Gram-positive bacteria)]|uniref:transposase n=1 Tax=Rhodococcus sp. TaxID=1831 RepID=UPI00257B91BE|nr:transposase [Rhodococcus sp. (in: high G+C Gram-positive bacteria)]
MNEYDGKQVVGEARRAALRSGLKAQVHSVLARAGVLIPVSDLFGVTGREEAGAGAARRRVRAAGDLTARADRRPRRPRGVVHRLRSPPNCVATAGIRRPGRCPASGPRWPGVFVAEIGDVHQFTDPAHLGSWAGLTPKHRESFRRGVPRAHHQTGQQTGALGDGSRPSNSHPAGTKISTDRTRIEARRGKSIAKIAAARKLLTLVYYGLRDGHIRALTHSGAA